MFNSNVCFESDAFFRFCDLKVSVPKLLAEYRALERLFDVEKVSSVYDRLGAARKAWKSADEEFRFIKECYPHLR